MRLLLTLNDQLEATHFSEFLKSEGIDNECEVIPNTDWGSPEYGTFKCNIWIIEEDQLERASRWAEEFKKNPNNPVFLKRGLSHTASLFANPENPLSDSTPSPTTDNPPDPATPALGRGLGVMTLYLLMTCTLLFMYGQVTTPRIHIPSSIPLPLLPLYAPPINKLLMYDYPAAFELVDRLVRAYGIDRIQHLQDLNPDGRILLEKALNTPYWQGVYDLLVDKLKNPQAPWPTDVPMFEKIRQGELWRLFTPCLLHGNMFHLFFNMIWLLVLGKMMEERLGVFRYSLFIVVVAIFSNTVQYLMSGPEFIGFSGVICGMLGFVWVRQYRVAWEGYKLMPGVIPFMFFFILSMAAIQFVAFILEVFWNYPSLSLIANSAHIAGGLIGYLLGRLNFFGIKKFS
jgi:GlpG protein